MRAHSAVAPASPQAGVTPIRSRSTERANPSRSVMATAAFATSSDDGRAAGAVDGNDAEQYRASAFDELADAVEIGRRSSVDTSTDTA